LAVRLLRLASYRGEFHLLQQETQLLAGFAEANISRPTCRPAPSFSRIRAQSQATSVARPDRPFARRASQRLADDPINDASSVCYCRHRATGKQTARVAYVLVSASITITGRTRWGFGAELVRQRRRSRYLRRVEDKIVQAIRSAREEPAAGRCANRNSSRSGMLNGHAAAIVSTTSWSGCNSRTLEPDRPAASSPMELPSETLDGKNTRISSDFALGGLRP